MPHTHCQTSPSEVGLRYMMKSIIIFAILLVLATSTALTIYFNQQIQDRFFSQDLRTPVEIIDSETTNGEEFDQFDSDKPLTTDQVIILESPQEGDIIDSPLTITGQARGQWYFEANFPVVLTNWDGLIIAEGYAVAQDDWMTEEFVPFVAELEFDKPDYGERGSLILQKANPSGLPEHDDALEITVFFDEII
jgi:hypothetical protein